MIINYNIKFLNGPGKLTLLSGIVLEGIWDDNTLLNGQIQYDDHIYNGDVYIDINDYEDDDDDDDEDDDDNEDDENKNNKFIPVKSGNGTLTYTNGEIHKCTWFNGKKHGPLTITYPDGNVNVTQWYNGDILEERTYINYKGSYHGFCTADDINHGFGKMTYIGGHIEEGIWDIDMINGKVIYPNGTVFEGEIEYEHDADDVPIVLVMNGKTFLTNGLIYEGTFRNNNSEQGFSQYDNDSFNFNGTISFGTHPLIIPNYINGNHENIINFNQGETFTGEISFVLIDAINAVANLDDFDNLDDSYNDYFNMHGVHNSNDGILMDCDGVQQICQIKRNTILKNRSVTLDNGSILTSFNFNDKMKVYGDGHILFSNGNKYNGHIKNNKMHGLGTLNFNNNSSYEGRFRYNQFNGLGTYRYPNGHYFKGYFKDGMKNDIGKMFDETDIEYDNGLWLNDILIKSMDDLLLEYPDDVCAVCFDYVSTTHKVCKYECEHFTCLGCSNKWTGTCPTCRSDFKDQSSDSNNGWN